MTSLINEKVTSLVSELHASQDSVKSSMKKTVKIQLEEHEQQTESQLTGLQSHMTSELAELQSNISSLNASMNRISDNVEAHDNHVTTELMDLDQNLQENLTLLLNNTYGYSHTCGGTGGWRRVVYMNFTDPNTPCPSGWQLTSHSKRTCGLAITDYRTCDSVTFPVSGRDYTRVCGRIIAYQYGSTYAFLPYMDGRVTTIDGPYVDGGISLTHGSPRQHIWTFAAGDSEFPSPWRGSCPCDATIDIDIPPFVGEDYFCESGKNVFGNPSGTFLGDDPLWDGDGCRDSSTCCSFNNPPYFTKQLPSPTTDDIEARLCNYLEPKSTPIEFIELYVQ